MLMYEDLDFYCGLSTFYECQSCFSSEFLHKTLTIKPPKIAAEQMIQQMIIQQSQSRSFLELGQPQWVAPPNDSSGNRFIRRDKPILIPSGCRSPRGPHGAVFTAAESDPP